MNELNSARLGQFVLLVWGLCMWSNFGSFDPVLVPASAVVFGIFAWAYLARPGQTTPESELQRAQMLLVLLFLLCWYRSPELRAFDYMPGLAALQGLLILSSLAFALGFLGRWQRPAWTAMVALLGTLHLVVLTIMPVPEIDVWHWLTAACRHLLSGHNPYTGYYFDVNMGRYPYPPGFHYPPGGLLWFTPFLLVFAEVRIGLWAVQLANAGILYYLARRQGLSATTCRLQPMVALTFPAGLLVVANAWFDQVMVFWVLLALLAARNNRHFWSGCALGLAVCTKQSAILYVVLLVVVWRFQPVARWRAALLGGVLSITGVCLPFFLAAPGAFWENVTRVAGYGVREDGFTLIAWLYNHGLDLSTGPGLGLAYLALTGLVAWRVRLRPDWATWLGAGVVLTGAIYYLGKQAFCNYYDALATLLQAYLVLMTVPTRADEAEPR